MSTAYGGAKQLFLLTFLCLLSQRVPAAQNPQGVRTSDALRRLNESIEALVQRVSPSVAQIIVTGYGSTEESDRGQTSVIIGRQRAVGSGVIVDAEGYIVTNAHVVNGAEKIDVVVPTTVDAASDGSEAHIRGTHGRNHAGNRPRRHQD